MEPPPAGTTTKMANGKTYYWCKHHKKDGTLHVKGLWCLHKQADCRLKGSQHSSSSTGGFLQPITSKAKGGFYPRWKSESPPAGTTTKTSNGKTYYWCKHHTKDGTLTINGLWCLHKQADCRLKGSQHSSSSTGGLSFAASTLHVYRTLKSQRRL